MTLLVIVGGVLLILLAALPIAWPLWRERSGAFASDVEPEPADPLVILLERRDSIYQSIKELAFDYQVGKVSKADYQAFDSQLKDQAVAVLKEIDALQAAVRANPKLDARLEAQIAALRRNGRQPAPRPEKPAPPLPDRAEAPAARYCSQCGAKARSDDRFCGRCGAALALQGVE